jgi:hypothetical protein
MTQISVQQARARFKIISANLQDLMFSVSAAETIRRVCHDNHVPNDKIPLVADATGFVILGFIHPEELAKEIQDRSGLPPEICKTISDSLNTRLFASVTEDLNKVYAPAPIEPEKVLEEMGVKIEPLPAKAMEEIKRPLQSMSKPATAPVSMGVAQGIPAPMRISVVSAPPSPTKQVLPLISKPVQMPTPVTPQPVTPAPAKPMTEIKPPPQKQFAPTASPVPPAPPTATPRSSPFLIFKEAEFHPIKEPPKIKTFIPGTDLKTAPNPIAEPQRAARIELGGVQEFSGPKMARSDILPTRVVHYTDLRTQLEIPKPPSITSQGAPIIPKPGSMIPTPVPLGTLGLNQGQGRTMPTLRPQISSDTRPPSPPIPDTSTWPPTKAPDPNAPKPPRVINF